MDCIPLETTSYIQLYRVECISTMVGSADVGSGVVVVGPKIHTATHTTKLDLGRLWDIVSMSTTLKSTSENI